MASSSYLRRRGVGRLPSSPLLSLSSSSSSSRRLFPSSQALASPLASYSTSSSTKSSASTPPKNDFAPLVGKKWDAIVVGGGHNGLVSAAYLAKAGKKVLVLERRHLVGGAAVTEELHPGYKYSRASYLCSLFRPQIIKDLDLKRHGLKLYLRSPSSFTPLHDGRYLLIGGIPMSETQKEIAKFSKADAEVFPEYEGMLERLVSFINPLIDEPPPNITTDIFSGGVNTLAARVAYATRMGKRVLSLGKDLPAFWEIMTAPASQILSKWFESEPLKSTLATDAIIGAMTSPNVPGSGYVLFHHVMGESEGIAGAWSYVQGGMGALSNAIASAAREAGVEICTNAPVSSILTSSGKATGVELADGTKLEARAILSNATPEVTFRRLLSDSAQQDLPYEFRRHIAHIDYTSPVMKINVAMNQIPNFKAYPNAEPGKPGPQHRGTIHLVSNCEEIEEAYQDALSGVPSKRPVIEMTIPSSLDPTLAPPGHHVASLFIQYVPYKPKNGEWNDKMRNAYADRVFDVIEEYAPGFKKSVVHRDVLAPPDLERVIGLTGGNIFHGAMGLNQLFFLRPAPGFAQHRTPLSGLYLCGSGGHPGGGVMGAPGRNCAGVVLADSI